MKLDRVRTGYLAYELDEASRHKLLELFPPQFPDVIAHHVTLQYPAVKPEFDPSQVKVMIRVIGHVDDDSLEALVVEVNGQSIRPDGKTFHCTWSMDKAKGRKAAQSNVLIAQAGYTPTEPVTVTGTLQFYYG